jgi:putative tryptophan/tyrosine transport system substrate-binding protein
MRRRDFIRLLGGTSAWPLAAGAQQPMLPVVGFLNSGSAGALAPMVDGFRSGLNERGFVEGRDVAIEFRWADNQIERLPSLAADLVSRRVAVIAATGGPVTGLAVKAASTDIPLVFISGVDPVKLGLVASINRPGGNATGINLFITAVEAKRLGLLAELVPGAARIGVIVNPKSPELDAQLSDVQLAARSMQRDLHLVRAASGYEIDAAFVELSKLGTQALLVAGDPLFNSQRDHIVALAERHAVPAIYEARSYATAGGLMSYGPNLIDMYRQVGVYVAQILRGTKPAALPVLQPTVLELVINLKTAKALGLDVPPTLLARADEVIE